MSHISGYLAKLALWKNWHSGKTGALAKLTSTLANWRSSETVTLALWQTDWQQVGKLTEHARKLLEF
jgi:hypothetical protein